MKLFDKVRQLGEWEDQHVYLVDAIENFYQHNGWMVEDLRDEAGGRRLYKVWIPEPKVSEVRRGNDLERPVLRTPAPKGEPDG